jgi:hypothetical protein
MKIRLLFSFLLAISVHSAMAQHLYTFSGKVTNAGSVPLAGTSVYLLNTNRGTASDEQGNFTLKNLPPGKYTVQVSAIGYATTDLDISLGSSSSESINIKLTGCSHAIRRRAGKRTEDRRIFTTGTFKYYCYFIPAGTAIPFMEPSRADRDCTESLLFQFRR